MKNVMILSAGTATAWHIASVIKKYYENVVHLTICDINERCLVHTSVFADRYLKVPPIKAAGYYETMLHYIDECRTDILIPLIDEDILLFSRDNPDLLSRHVYSVTTNRTVFLNLSNKKNLSKTLSEIGVITPHIYEGMEEIEPETEYFVKDPVGCGSRGAFRMTGRQILAESKWESHVVQKICTGPEITVDAVLDNGVVRALCRERMETKLGVSTKCRVYFDREIKSIIQKIADSMLLPDVFCIQFMKNSAGQWSLIDFNLRSGGGTAISAAVGFEAVRFAAAGWLGEKRDPMWLQYPKEDRYVVRTYTEIVTK